MSLFVFGDLSLSDIDRYVRSLARLADAPVVIHVVNDVEDTTDAGSEVNSTPSIAAKQDET